jgi:hypothetical protein
MAVLLKHIYRFNVIINKIPLSFFTEIEKSALKFIGKHKIPSIQKAILSINNNARGITILVFTLYNRTTVTKTAWYWTKTDSNTN